MRALRLRLDTRGRVLLTPAMRTQAGLAPGVGLAVAVADGELHITPGDGAARGRAPTLDRKGRLTLPGAVRLALGLAPGTVLLLKIEENGIRLVTPSRLIGRLKLARLALAEQNSRL